MVEQGGNVKSFEDQSLERANKVTLLLKNRQDFHDIYNALTNDDERSFIETCKHAGIDDTKFIAHMWKTWQKISDKSSKGIGPVW